MQFAAVLVEYFITGATAMLWLLPLVGVRYEKICGATDNSLILLLPIAYVVGHAVDAVSYVLIHSSKNLIKKQQKAKRAQREKQPESDRWESDAAYLLMKAPDVGRHLEMLSSRDRIARGAILNALVIALVALLPSIEWWPVSNRYGIAGIALCVALVMFAAWWRFESNTRSFKKEAVLT